MLSNVSGALRVRAELRFKSQTHRTRCARQAATSVLLLSKAQADDANL